MERFIATAEKSIMQTYSRFPLVLSYGEGMYVYDTEGKKYLDFVAGIAVNALGHNHQGLVDAITEQAKAFLHVSNLYYTKPQIALAEKLIQNTCFDKVFFCNSGAEAVEGAMKLCRKYSNKSYSNRHEIITMQQSFHGRTYGAMSATGQEKYQKGFQPLVPGIRHVPFNDISALRHAVSDKTCAIIIEPIQGEGGIRPAKKQYLRDVRKLCDEKDILLVFDEIQCGVGRTGFLFAYQYYGVDPDLLVTAKGLAGGVPIGALMANEKTSDTFAKGDHASTFGGNPLATSAGTVIMKELIDNNLLQQVKRQGKYLEKRLSEIQNKFSVVSDLRGVGLMMGLEFSIEVAPIIKKAMELGLLLVSSGTRVIRFVPPLIVTEKEIDDMIEILRESIASTAYLKAPALGE